jgi:hypothetical protein
MYTAGLNIRQTHQPCLRQQRRVNRMWAVATHETQLQRIVKDFEIRKCERKHLSPFGLLWQKFQRLDTWLKEQKCICHSSGEWNIRVPTWSCSVRALLSIVDCCLLLVSSCAENGKRTFWGPIHEGSTFMIYYMPRSYLYTNTLEAFWGKVALIPL